MQPLYFYTESPNAYKFNLKISNKARNPNPFTMDYEFYVILILFKNFYNNLGYLFYLWYRGQKLTFLGKKIIY